MPSDCENLGLQAHHLLSRWGTQRTHGRPCITSMQLPESLQRMEDPSPTWSNRPHPFSLPLILILPPPPKLWSGLQGWCFLQAPGHSSISILWDPRCTLRLAPCGLQPNTEAQLHRNHLLLRQHFFFLDTKATVYWKWHFEKQVSFWKHYRNKVANKMFRL